MNLLVANGVVEYHVRGLIDGNLQGVKRELPLDQKQALASHLDKSIAARAKALLAKGGGLPNADRQKVVEEYLPLLKKTGNVELGKAHFKVAQWYAYSARQMAQSELVFGSHIENDNFAGP